MSQYASCVGRNLKGKMSGMSKVDRKKKFCMVSKVCSGRASTEAQAASMCK